MLRALVAWNRHRTSCLDDAPQAAVPYCSGEWAYEQVPAGWTAGVAVAVLDLAPALGLVETGVSYKKGLDPLEAGTAHLAGLEEEDKNAEVLVAEQDSQHQAVGRQPLLHMRTVLLGLVDRCTAPEGGATWKLRGATHSPSVP